jgi:hypothetical protein
MEMFKNIRLSRGRSILRKKILRLRRIRFRGNILSAKKIGLLWDATNPDEFQVLSQFHQKMQERNVELNIIGYYPGKELPDKITAIRYLVCLKQQDISFTYRPVSYEASRFMNTAFDILIDANFKNMFPLEYISSLSSAGLKVGIFSNSYEHSPFDLMIEVNKNSDLNNYLDQVVHYLEMINTGSNNIRE